MNGRKRVKTSQQAQNKQIALKILHKIKGSSLENTTHPFQALMKKIQSQKHPILPTLSQKSDIYKTNPDKKKKPIELYLDTVNNLYKKKDLDLLINPIHYSSVFQNWAPRQIAIFQQAILKFGKQFQFIAELIQTKSAKQVYQFYIQWKTTSHYKSFKIAQNSGNREIIFQRMYQHTFSQSKNNSNIVSNQGNLNKYQKYPHILRNGAISYLPQNPVNNQININSANALYNHPFKPLKRIQSQSQKLQHKNRIYYPPIKIEKQMMKKSSINSGCSFLTKKAVYYDIDYQQDQSIQKHDDKGWNMCG